MIHKKTIIVAAIFAAIGITMFGTQTLAKDMDVGREDMSPAKHMDGVRDDMSPAENEDVMDKKIEIEQRLTTMKEAHTEKLDTKRLEVCQQRQEKINDIVAHGVEQNTKQLAVFQKIEANVKQFYIDKNLSVDTYAAAVATADDAKASAVASIEASAETTFDCTTTDGANPGSIIKEVMTTRHSSLAAYRTAIKNLILVVKKANSQEKTTDTAPSSTSEVKG